jgi:hypothetical protein
VEIHLERWRIIDGLRELHNIDQVEEEMLGDLKEGGRTGGETWIMP